MLQLASTKTLSPKAETWTLENERFSYYECKERKSPTAIWSVPDLIDHILNDVELQVRTETMRAVYHTEGKSEKFSKLKGQLPAVIASAIMNGVDKREVNIKDMSNLLTVDIDHLNEERTRELKERLKSNTSLPWILAYRSPSDGLKILMAYDKERYTTREVYPAFAAAVADALQIEASKFDMSCANPSRLNYICHDAELIINPDFLNLEKGAFPMEEYMARAKELFGETKRKAKKVRKAVAPNSQNTEGATAESTLSETDKSSLSVIKRNLLTAAKYVAEKNVHVCDAYDDYLAVVSGMAHDFPTDEEVKEACRTICKHSNGYDEAAFEKLYADQSAIECGNDRELITSRTAFKMCVDAIAASTKWIEGNFSSQLDYAKLPELMKRIAELDESPVFKDVLTITAFCVIGAATPFRYVKVNAQKGAANMFFLFIAPSANNKSKLNDVFLMPKKVDEEKRLKSDNARAEWQAKVAENPNIPKPRIQSYTFSCDTTSRALFNNLEANNAQGCLISTEAHTLLVSKNKKNVYGDMSSLLCQCYEREPVNLDRGDDVLRIADPSISFVGTATPKTLEALMDYNAFESGLASRCAIVSLPAEVAEFLDIRERQTLFRQREDRGTVNYLQESFLEYYKMCKSLRKTVMVMTTPFQDQLLQTFYCSAKRQFHDLVFRGPGYTQSDITGGPLFNRGFDRVWRIMTILASYELFEKRRAEGKLTFFDGEAPSEIFVSDDIVEASILIDQWLMSRTFEALAPMIENIKEQERMEACKKSQKKRNRMADVFKLLPESFTTHDIEQKAGIGPSRANDFRKYYEDHGWISKHGTSYVKQTGALESETSQN